MKDMVDECSGFIPFLFSSPQPPPSLNAPLTAQQQAAIVALSHGVAERLFPPNLAQDVGERQENGLVQEPIGPAAIEAVLVNTNQLMEKARSIEFTDALHSRLNYFDELENVAEFIQIVQQIWSRNVHSRYMYQVSCKLRLLRPKLHELHDKHFLDVQLELRKLRRN
ncbi:hypothetical protein Droror1_Dr00016243 [Drosera rotundifolia]